MSQSVDVKKEEEKKTFSISRFEEECKEKSNDHSITMVNDG